METVEDSTPKSPKNIIGVIFDVNEQNLDELINFGNNKSFLINFLNGLNAEVNLINGNKIVSYYELDDYLVLTTNSLNDYAKSSSYLLY